MKIQLGRQDESSQISPASCSMTLNNRDGRFTTRNPVGAYYGTIGQNTPFRLSVPAYLAGQGTALLFADDSQCVCVVPGLRRAAADERLRRPHRHVAG